jgi:hypothetical protein
MPDDQGNVIDRKIPQKDLDNITRFARGAIARRLVTKLQAIKIFESLMYPCYKDKAMADSEDRLFDTSELECILSTKGFTWKKEWTDIGTNKKWQG